jgi:hypothetical protein
MEKQNLPAPGADETPALLDRQRALARLDVFIGKWINEGRTIPTKEAPVMRIVTSDIYEWAAGGSFVVHSAYGLIGDRDGGGTEIIGYDDATGAFRCFFFDSKGGITVETLVEGDGVWVWTGERTRCTATFSEDGRTQHAHHEWSDDGEHWHPSMDVTLTKIL